MFYYRFVKHPEYLKEGQRLVFREGRTKAVGNVNKVLPYTPAVVGKEKVKTAAKATTQQVLQITTPGSTDQLI